VTGDGVLGDTETALFVRLMEPHVNPSTVLLGPRLVCLPGPLFEEGVADLPIDMLLLEAVLIRLVYLAVEVLKAGMAKSKELVVDEAILDVVELVDVIHNCLTLILHKMLDKGISADGKANVAINHKARRREQRTEVIEGGIGNEHAHGGSVHVGCRDTLDEKFGLRLLRVVEIVGVFLEYMLMSESGYTDSLIGKQKKPILFKVTELRPYFEIRPSPPFRK
jgi:hypothetical protein